MRIVLRVVVLAAFATRAFADEPAPAGLKDLGWLAGTCLATAAPGVSAGTPVQVVVLGEPQTVQAVEVVGPAGTPETCDMLGDGRTALVDGAKASLFEVTAWSAEPGDVAVAVIGGTAPVLADGIATATVDGRAGVVFDMCQTSEGLRFNAWSGKAGNGQPLWEGYYGLGYDVDPTCG